MKKTIKIEFTGNQGRVVLDAPLYIENFNSLEIEFEGLPEKTMQLFIENSLKHKHSRALTGKTLDLPRTFITNSTIYMNLVDAEENKKYFIEPFVIESINEVTKNNFIVYAANNNIPDRMLAIEQRMAELDEKFQKLIKRREQK